MPGLYDLARVSTVLEKHREIVEVKSDPQLNINGISDILVSPGKRNHIPDFSCLAECEQIPTSVD